MAMSAVLRFSRPWRRSRRRASRWNGRRCRRCANYSASRTIGKKSARSAGKTREREQFAKFTHAVSQDSPWAGLANIAFKPPPNLTVKAMLADSRITVLLKNGYVYGDYLDIQIAGMKAQHMETTGDMLQVFKMIARGRAQITFAPVDEIRYYLDAGAISRADTKVIEFPEMPAGYKRYLMCSKQVDDQTIAQFNAALSTP